MKRPSFQFYPGDWLSSQRVALMSLEEEGAYIRALAFCWNHGSIPSDPDKLSRLIGKGASTTLATTLATMFEPDPNHPGQLVHARLNAERAKQDEWTRKSAEGGRKSAEMRQSVKGGSATVESTVERVDEKWLQPNGNSSSSFPSSSSSSSLTPTPTPKPKQRPDGLRDEELERALRLGRLFGRRPDTAWSKKEVAKFREFIVGMASEDLELLVWYYQQPGLEYRRKTLSTLLNNIPSELDLALAHKNRPPSLFDGLKGVNIANGASEAVKAVSPNVLIIQWTKELDDCQEKLDSIKDSYDGHQDWTVDDVNRYNRILGRKKELKKLLERKE